MPTSGTPIRLRPDVANLAVQATDLNVGDAVCQGIKALKPGTAPSDGGLSEAGKAAPNGNKTVIFKHPGSSSTRSTSSIDATGAGWVGQI